MVVSHDTLEKGGIAPLDSLVFVVTPADLAWHLANAASRLLLQLWPAFLLGLFSAVAPEDWGELCLVFHPSAGLLQSPYAVGSIWLAHHGGPDMRAA